MGNFFSSGSGGIGGLVGGILGTEDEEKNNALSDYSSAFGQAKTDLSSKFADAGSALASGYTTAQDTAKTGYDEAESTTKSGYKTAQEQLSSGGNSAIDTAKSGYDEAQTWYDTPEMVTSRAELYNRVLGKGGYDEGTINSMKSGAIESYGSSARDIADSLQSYYGDSTASGLAGENLSRGIADLGATKANSLKDIDISNAELVEEQQTDAITSLSNEAYQRAGLSADEAEYVSGLQYQLASDTASLTKSETDALAGIAASRGETLSGLQADLATGQASLTAEEAKALAELSTAEATGELTAGTTSNLFQSIWG